MLDVLIRTNKDILSFSLYLKTYEGHAETDWLFVWLYDFIQAEVSIGFCKYDLVIWLIKITDATVEEPRSRPHLVEGQTATEPRQLVTKTDMDQGWWRGVSTKFIPWGCFMRASRSPTARDYSSRPTRTRGDREQTRSLTMAVSWINVIALLNLSGPSPCSLYIGKANASINYLLILLSKLNEETYQ